MGDTYPMIGRRREKKVTTRRKARHFFFSFLKQLLKSMTTKRKLKTGRKDLHRLSLIEILLCPRGSVLSQYSEAKPSQKTQTQNVSNKHYRNPR